jgi:hypothetical protein
MAITASTLPAVVPNYVVPREPSLELCSAQVATATGRLDNVNAVVDIGGGRKTGMLALDISAAFFGSSDEYYRFFLFGSNDITFANGNVELLAANDFSNAVATRIVPTILGASPTIPDAGRGGTLHVQPFTNLKQGIIYSYLKLYLVTSGTTPSVTVTAWVSPIEMRV